MPKRNINLPPVHNKRSPEQWRIISQRVDFDGKTVLDLGCGYGDILLRAVQAGASAAHGVDFNAEALDCLLQLKQSENIPEMALVYTNIEDAITHPGAMGRRDIIVCFSVLPYLDNPTATLRWIREHSTQALIECQLAGDGPGLDWLESPRDMRRWLDGIGWESIERIGETTVKERQAKRGIWLCQ